MNPLWLLVTWLGVTAGDPAPPAGPGAAAHVRRIFPPPPPGTPPPWKDLSAADRQALLATLHDEPLPERLLDASVRFINVPYVFSPLGEGEGKDPDPPLRYDEVDCLSLVEETLAMSLTPAPEGLEHWLAQIRYGPQISYEGRNHLMEAQWLPHAEALGILHPVTARYGGPDTVSAKTVVTKESWLSPSSRALELPPDRQAVGTFSYDLIPLEHVARRLKDVPSGTVLVVVRDARPFKVTRMTHLGFVVQKGHRVYLRHASKSRHGRVVDEDLQEFLTRNARYDKWPVTGVALYEVTEPSNPSLPTPAPHPSAAPEPEPAPAPPVHASAGAPAP